MLLPCGKCAGCYADKRREWGVRAYHESLMHQQNSFLTLTYDDEHLPLDGKIDPYELQLFMKRLRKAVYPIKIRYLSCGEYGDLTLRPHYHLLIFGQDFRANSKTVDLNGGYTSALVEDCWTKGLCHITSLTPATCFYVAGYASKKLDNHDTFIRMSKSPPLGYEFARRFPEELRQNERANIHGAEYTIPKQYFSWFPEEYQELVEARREYAREQGLFETLWKAQQKQIINKSKKLQNPISGTL